MIKLEEVLRDKKKLSVFFSRAVPLTSFIDVPCTISSAIVCPFHDDSSPSAKLFNDEDGTVRLYCFTEHRQFTSYDYVVYILKADPILFLTEKFSESEMQSILHKVNFSISARPVVVDFGDNGGSEPVVDFLNRIYFTNVELRRNV